MVASKFSRLAFGGGEAGELAAEQALAAHESALVAGVHVRVYRGQPEGMTGVCEGHCGGRSYRVRAADGLGWEIESRNLELAE